MISQVGHGTPWGLSRLIDVRPPRLLLQAIVGLVAFIYLIYYLGAGVPIRGEFARPLGAAVSAVSILVLLFDMYLWKLPVIRSFTGNRPYVQGTWRGIRESHWEDPETGKRVPPDPEVYLVVRQTYWSMYTWLLTRESKSSSILAAISDQGGGSFGLFSLYRNIPRAPVRYRSPIHHGALMLDVGGSARNPTRLEGFYWTDRRTMGELRLEERSPRLVGDYESAKQLLPPTRSGESSGPGVKTQE